MQPRTRKNWGSEQKQAIVGYIADRIIAEDLKLENVISKDKASAGRLLRLLRHAQDEVIATHLHRKIIQTCGYPWLRGDIAAAVANKMLAKHHEPVPATQQQSTSVTTVEMVREIEVIKEVVKEVPANISASPTEELVVELFRRSLRAGIEYASRPKAKNETGAGLQEIATALLILSETFAAKQATPVHKLNGQHEKPKGDVVQIDLESKKEHTPKPKVLIVGLIADQIPIIDSQFSGKMKIYHKKDSEITDHLPQVDLVLVSKFISHAHSAILEKRYGRDFVEMEKGGMNHIINRLRAFLKEPVTVGDTANA